MKVKMLVENTRIVKNYKKKHGLSLFIESQNHKILFDLGPNDLFLNNASKLGVKVDEIDTVVISHGHVDHGGGLSAFIQNNDKAKIFMQKLAFEPYYTNFFGFKIYVGLDTNLTENKRIIFTEKDYQLDQELQLFSNVKGNIDSSESNKSLYCKIDGKYRNDLFEHEQNLIIKENDKYILFAGCAHKGIINILNKAEELCGQELDCVVGGFHLFNPVTRKTEDINLIKSIAEKLKTKKTKYYTCHCTGRKPYNILHSYLGEKIQYLSTGSILEI